MADELRIPKLDGNNYYSWAIRTKSILIQKDIWDAIEPGFPSETTEKQKRKDNLALSVILLAVEDSLLDDIGDCKRAIDAWQILEDIHTKYGLLHILQLLREFFNIIKRNDEDVKKYFARIMECHRKLAKCHHGFGDGELALIMLLGLPKSYEPLILSLEQQEEKLSTSMVKSKLLLEEKRQKQRQIPQEDPNCAFAVRRKEDTCKSPCQEQNKFEYDQPRNYHNTWTEGKRENYNYSRRIRCFNCGKLGYIARICRFANSSRRISEGMLKQSTLDLTHKVLFANNLKNNSQNIWFLDSGATEHMTSNRLKMTNTKSISTSVEMANNEKIKVSEMGDVTIKLCHEYGGETLFLENVLYVPELDGNILSVGRIEERGNKVLFQNGKASVFGSDGGLILKSNRRGRIYTVEELKIAKVKSPSADIWHRRLGHIYKRDLQNVSDTAECEVCLEGKMRRLPFPSKPFESKRTSSPLELIHSDVRQLTVRRTPQQNGTAERMNQTLLNTARCILLESGIPISFWADAVNTACYLRNKCSSKAISNKIPEEMWTERSVKIEHFRVFGCQTWTYNDQRRSKFDSRSRECVLIGYPEGVKGYKVWDIRNNKVFVTRNVRFRDVFPTKKIDKQISHETDFFQVFHDNFEEDYESVNEEKKLVERNQKDEHKKEDEEGQNEATIPRGYSGTDETISEENNLNNMERREDGEQAYEDEALRREDEEGQNETIITKRSSRIAARQKEYCRSAFHHGIIEHKNHRDEIPSSYEEALNMPKVQDRQKSIECEMASLREYRVWDADLPNGVKRKPNQDLDHSRPPMRTRKELVPKNNLLKKYTPWHWDAECQHSFDTLKECLTTKPVLHLFIEGLPCQLFCDASLQGIAGILKQQHPDGTLHPVQYYSRAIRPHEKNYTITELECLAVIDSVEKFRIYLAERRRYTVGRISHPYPRCRLRSSAAPVVRLPSSVVYLYLLELPSRPASVPCCPRAGIPSRTHDYDCPVHSTSAYSGLKEIWERRPTRGQSLAGFIIPELIKIEFKNLALPGQVKTSPKDKELAKTNQIAAR
ncbi:hypothetical protein LAZ67_2003141 [Cordylochernes scorpioides]|uniref:Retrovirus-related Pol polyprotein from transposon TNT 1-94 n=1 Tax=Cordylochernes scorpioides TaxID=51811 RepID=A0ABY6K2J4_9ARAC|nr:hypothetical protein LAZ67_2003141 [Cordylochernes scorpioides]